MREKKARLERKRAKMSEKQTERESMSERPLK